MKPIAIFKPGKHAPNTPNFSLADVKRIASTYDPGKHEAPVVVGHPKTNAPAFGWVDKLSVGKGGVLFAHLKDVNQGFAKMVKDGAFRKISASIYKPSARNNPAKGGFSLRHVGFLGAAPPAVQGLPAVSFAAGDDDSFVVDFAAEDGGAEDEDVANLSETIKQLSERIAILEAEKPTMSEKKNTETAGADDQANFAEREAELSKKTADLEKREAAVAKAELAARRKEHESFAEGLASAGQLLPRHQNGLVELLTGLSAEQTVNFAAADGEEKEHTALEFVKDVFSALPKQIEYAELAKDDGARPGDLVNFNAPPGMDVDKTHADIHKKATTHAREKGIPYAEALAQVSA